MGLGLQGKALCTSTVRSNLPVTLKDAGIGDVGKVLGIEVTDPEQ